MPVRISMPLVYGLDSVDVKLTLFDGGDHILSQHQVDDVGGRNKHPLIAAQPPLAADIKEAFYFFVGPRLWPGPGPAG